MITCGAQNDSLATLLARLEGILGPVPRRMLRDARFAHRYYTRAGALFERSPRSVRDLGIAPHEPGLTYRAVSRSLFERWPRSVGFPHVSYRGCERVFWSNRCTFQG